ncbi:MAG: PorV/PorQ family protein [Caldithrix sp.]|nr:PorV/PorQ family protein [Caldithrix sp.]
MQMERCFKMKVHKIIPLLLMLLALAYGQSKVGTTAGNFLQIGVGCRAIAMGGSAVSYGMDASAVYWNPALAANLKQNQAYFNNISWFAGINLNYGGLVLNLGRFGNVGASFYVMNSGEMEVTTEERPEGTGELFTVQELSAGLTYSRQLTQRFFMGGTFKYIHSSIWNMKASAIAVDLGLSYRTPYEPLILGMSISNFGSEMRLHGPDAAVRFDPDPRVDGNNDGIIAYQITRSWDLPVTFRFGTAYEVIKSEFNTLLVSLDVLYPNNNENYVNAGIEYSIQNRYFLRAGYRQLFLNDAEGGFTIGGGMWLKNILIDYAYSDRGRLNNVQYISLGLSF